MQTYTEITEENIDSLSLSDGQYYTILNMEALSAPGVQQIVGARGPRATSHPFEFNAIRPRLKARLRAIRAFKLPFRMEYVPQGVDSISRNRIAGNTIYLRPNGVLSGTQNNTQRKQLQEQVKKRRETLTATQAQLDREVATLMAMPREKRSIIGYDLLSRIVDDVKTWPHVLEATWGGVLDKAAPTITTAPNEAAVRFVPVMFRNPNNQQQWTLTTPMVFRMPQATNFIPKSIDGMGHPHTYGGSGDLCWGQGVFNNNLHNNMEQLARWVIGLNERSIAEPTWYTLAHNWWRANADRFFELNPNPVYVKGNPANTTRDAEVLPLTRDIVDAVLAANGNWARTLPNPALVEALRSNNFRLVERITAIACAQCGNQTRRVVRYGTNTTPLCEHCISNHTERWNVLTPDVPADLMVRYTPLRASDGYQCHWDSSLWPAHAVFTDGARMANAATPGQAAVLAEFFQRNNTARAPRTLYVCRAHYHRLRMTYSGNTERWPVPPAAEAVRYTYTPPVAWGEPTADEVRRWNEGFGNLNVVQEILNENNETLATTVPVNDDFGPWFRAYVDELYATPYGDVPRRNNRGRFLAAHQLEILRYHQRRAIRGMTPPPPEADLTRIGITLNTAVDGEATPAAIAEAVVTAIPVFNIERNADGELVMRDRDNPEAEAVTIAEGTADGTPADWDVPPTTLPGAGVTITLHDTEEFVADVGGALGAALDGLAPPMATATLITARPHRDYYGNNISPTQPHFRYNYYWVVLNHQLYWYPLDIAEGDWLGVGNEAFRHPTQLPANYRVPQTFAPDAVNVPVIEGIAPFIRP